MKEIKRTANATKLYNRVLECENEFKLLYNTGFKLANLNQGLDEYLRIRSKLRCTYERLLIDESDFSLANGFESKLWEECYEKPINWIEEHLKKVTATKSVLHLRRLRSVLINFLDEGSTFFHLILRSPKVSNFQYKFLIFSSILARKRENISNSKSCKAFPLLQDAITTDPFRGFGYLVLAQWTLEDGDHLLSMYWALVACNVINPEITEKAHEFLKTLVRNLAKSPSFLNYEKSDNDCGQLLQMASHALLSLLTGQSHLKHLDQLSHSQLRNLNENTDTKSLKYSIISLWLILGMSAKENGQVTQVQSCILAKLFQVHCETINNEAINSILLAFASNPFYSKLFTGDNYKILLKINNFAYEKLNNFLKKLLESKSMLALHEQVYLDYLALKPFSSFTTDFDSLINYFVSVGLYHRTGNDIQLISTFEKAKKTERSIKLLTHQFLSTKLENIEAQIEPTHLPWTIPDYQCLLKQFPRIRKLIISREIRVLITMSVLQELDLDKSQRHVREIIRFLHERIDANDPCIKLHDGATLKADDFDAEFYSFRHRLKLDHLNSVRNFLINQNCVKIICSDPFGKEYLSKFISEELISTEVE